MSNADSGVNASALTPFERVEATLADRPVDRVPAFVLGMSCEVASELLGRTAYAGTGELRYLEACALARGEQAHAEFDAKLHEDLLAWHRHLELEVFHPPWRRRETPTRQVDEITFLYGNPDGDHEVWRYSPDTGDFACVESTKVEAEPVDRARAIAEGLEASLEERITAVRAQAHEIGRAQKEMGSEFAYIACGGAIGIGMSASDLMGIALAPDFTLRRTMAQARAGVAFGRALVKENAPRAILGGGDLASSKGPCYSPRLFREAVLPAYRHLVQHLVEIGVHYAFRSDGNIWPLADMLFVETGCAGFGEVDRDAGMNAGALREKYPDLLIWGNISSAFLTTATPAQVRDEARRILDETGGRRYIQGCSNAIVMGTPPANVEALFSVRR